MKSLNPGLVGVRASALVGLIGVVLMTDTKTLLGESLQKITCGCLLSAILKIEIPVLSRKSKFKKEDVSLIFDCFKCALLIRSEYVLHFHTGKEKEIRPSLHETQKIQSEVMMTGSFPFDAATPD